MPKRDPEFNPETHIYCKYCDIWYNKKEKEEAEKRRKKILVGNYPSLAIHVPDHPHCKMFEQIVRKVFSEKSEG